LARILEDTAYNWDEGSADDIEHHQKTIDRQTVFSVMQQRYKYIFLDEKYLDELHNDVNDSDIQVYFTIIASMNTSISLSRLQ
jgi:hypothetical protein